MAALDPSTRLRVLYDALPTVPNEAAAGSLGGGGVRPIGRPIEVSLQVEDAASGQAADASALGELAVELRLPVLADCQKDASFAWLLSVDEDEQFLGYLRVPGAFEPATSSLVYRLPASLLGQTLLLPVCVEPTWVMNHDPLARIWSGPTRGAIDFGAAAPQFTHMDVVGPQVGPRVFVFNPFTADYGWIDAEGVGPVGPPTDQP
jgi:hypothetical protein